MVRAACFERTRVTKILPTPVTIEPCVPHAAEILQFSDIGLHKYHKTLLYNSTLQSLYREARWPLASGRLRPSGGA